MASNEPVDGMAEELERHLQLALMTATIAARRAVTHRREALLEAQREGQARAEALRARIARERAASEAQLQAVFDPGWWERATPRDVGSMWEHAAQWREDAPDGVRSPAAEVAGERIEDEVRKRWGISVGELVALTELDELERQDDAAVEERQQPAATENKAPTDPLDVENQRVERVSTERAEITPTARSAVQADATNAAEADPARLDAGKARALADAGQGKEAIQAVREPATAGSAASTGGAADRSVTPASLGSKAPRSPRPLAGDRSTARSGTRPTTCSASYRTSLPRCNRESLRASFWTTPTGR